MAGKGWPRYTSDLDQIVAQAQQINRTLSTLDADTRAIVTQLMAQAAAPPFSINLPIPPATLTEMLLAANRSRQLGVLGAFTASITIPAGTALSPGKASLSLPNPDGKTVLFLSGIKGIASYYSTDVVLTLQADGQYVTGIYGSPNEFTVTGPFEFQATKYAYVTSNAAVVGYNKGSSPSTVTFGLDNFTMDNGTFQDYWLNIINLGTDQTKAVAGKQ